MGCSRNVHEMSLKHVSWIQLTKTSNLLWQITQNFIVNGTSKKFNEQCGLKNNLNRKKTWWVQGDIIKVWLESPWISSIFNIFKKLTLGRISPRYLYLNLFGGAYFHESRSLKACNIAERTCLSYVWTDMFPKRYSNLKFRYRTCLEQGAS